MSVLHFIIILPFIFALICPFLYKIKPRLHTGWFVIPVPIVIFGYFLGCMPELQKGEALTAEVPWIPSLGINITLYVDGLSLLFALLISGIGALVVLYSIFYLNKTKEALGQFYFYLLLFMGAMLGVVLSDNLIVLYGFWELTSISSFLLIAFWHQKKKSLYGALKSMLITVFGGLAMLSGFVLIYIMTDTFSIRTIVSNVDRIADHSLFVPAMLLVLLGAFTKSAQFPFHIWLPDAMEAPTPVSAYLHSATMVKAGLYLVARLSPVFAGEAGWFWLVSTSGILTLIYGSYRALKQTDLKSMLAFSTISQLGLIMSLLGLGSAAAIYSGTDEALFYVKATMAGIFHLINHAIFKGALFMVVGIIDHETGTRNIRKLGGLMSVMPVTFSIALIGTFSMAGLPPFNGFLSKEMFFTAVLNIMEMDVLHMQFIGIIFPIIAWIASIFTFIYSMLLLFRTFTGEKKFEQLAKKPHEAPLGMLLSPVVLASLAVVFGLFPNLLSYTLIAPAMAAIHPTMLLPGQQFDVAIHFWHGWTPEIFMTIGVVAMGTLFYMLHERLKVLNQPLFTTVSLNRSYDGGLKLLDKGAKGLTNRYMTGSNRHYLIYIFIFLIVSISITMSNSANIRFDFTEFAPMSVYEAVIIGALIVSVIAVPFARSRMMAIIWTGSAGYMVTLFFVIFRAPDLALTQMIVETVSVALFLLCFYHLPKLKKELVSLRFKLLNLIVSLGVGVTMTLLALSASSERSFESISDFFIKESYNMAGGKNIVNVILVDFRGFDTLLEITVLGIASYGIYALIRLKLEPEDTSVASGFWESGSKLPVNGARSNDVILKTIAKLVIFIILTFSLFLFFSGHNEPGGGFIGGLMTAAAFVLLAMAFGMKTIREVIPIDFRKVSAVGILVALLTGIGSFLYDVPFLSHTFGYQNLPLLGHSELATAMLFDLGVYLTVIGITMTIILTIGRDK
ncbi:multicomponent Na+:H+ antiporter subunit A [Paenibacillus algorifonticola]|uniref:Multicomponent Na+:H+ antiporter subunit A n=1 Tax=Paenibacillus algorifonticola TaxID=684063 RepID=A0A1I2J789_9BACL|nr:Na+/H+ antiporter subunit A [Paenibacillus algorifonticola]SFF49880.1 multicomponent Na+:H+ antiporter subunit A [Paenibacillus algorifonticola]